MAADIDPQAQREFWPLHGATGPFDEEQANWIRQVYSRVDPDLVQVFEDGWFALGVLAGGAGIAQNIPFWEVDPFVIAVQLMDWIHGEDEATE
jgi:hypothetical protein